MIENPRDEKNRRDELIILSHPRNRKGIDHLCTRAPKPAVETGQVNIFMIYKPVHRVRTPLLLGQKEIVSLDPSIIIIHDSTKKLPLSLAKLRIHSTSEVMQLSKHQLKICIAQKTLQIFLHASHFNNSRNALIISIPRDRRAC